MMHSFPRSIGVLVTHLLWPIIILTVGVFVHATEGCEGRTIYNATVGIVSDGPAKYPASAHCEWLIDGGGLNKFITLRFDSMATECSYDYLFVFDGNSYNSRLLGTFSGKSQPDPLLATSGYMLIYFFSDTNYVLNGFNARYMVTDCPYNCSERGYCDPKTHRCICDHEYGGAGCERELCPNRCSLQGSCDIGLRKCKCSPGFVGTDCSMPVNSPKGQSTWYEISPNGQNFVGRTGHGGVFLDASNSLWIFGGNTLNEVLDELVRFDFAQNDWEIIPETSPWPRGREFHKIVGYGRNFYMFGGSFANGSHTNELWFYDVTNNSWTLKAGGSSVKPKAVVGHTFTLVENEWLYVIGGRTDNSEPLSDIYRIKISEDTWEQVWPRGGKTAARRLVGHSAVYHPESKSILIFGGFIPDYARFPERTNYLHAYHVEENYWSQIYYDKSNIEPQIPTQRAFHSAVIMGNYMVIFGGNAHVHNVEEICYDNEIYAFHLGCHRWVDYKKMALAFPAMGSQKSIIPRGRFSHVAAVAYGNTLLISGGYRGSVLGDLMAYVVPPAIAKSWNDSDYTASHDHCTKYKDNHKDFDFCKSDPECVWCRERHYPRNAGCLHKSQLKQCKKVYVDRALTCPGICLALRDCGSCTVQGQGATLNNASLVNLQHNEECAWCVKEAKCQPRYAPSGMCSGRLGLAGIEGWWGRNSSWITNVNQCRLEDFPAGLHWIQYRHPRNLSHPDSVEIVRTTEKKFRFQRIIDEENILGGWYYTHLQGYIHPLGVNKPLGQPLQVELVTQTAQAWLYFSTDDKPQNKELVAQLHRTSYVNMLAKRTGNRPLFTSEARGYKYYMQNEARQQVAQLNEQQLPSTIQLKWNGMMVDKDTSRQLFTAEFLQPYTSGNCGGYTNCLACMTDSSCGWCPTSNSCILKRSTMLPASQCGATGGAHHLILQSLDCPVCADIIDCHTCARNPLCEWMVAEAHCVRRGRFPAAITNSTSCPTPCQQRSSCAECISEKNECAWCEQTRRCFPFVAYIMRYAHGGCTKWVDSVSRQEGRSQETKCRNCSRHDNFHSCLADFQCGWCGNSDNPTIGRCLHGDYLGPKHPGNCSSLIAEVKAVSPEAPANWSYWVIPDVEECRLGLDDCHPNATCRNTYNSFECTCKRGFTGDGKTVCNRTCYYECIHGKCAGAPTFECSCSIGWTGKDCNTNCGCNNHSYCSGGVGKCDKCEHWTMGSQCQYCRPGSFGEATTKGCIPCVCNGHGDEKAKYCNSTTGKCYCKDNTEGDSCQYCKSGYYGDPRNNGICYLQCDGRTILGNITEGALGSYAGAGVADPSHAYCLWILTVHPDLKNLRLLSVLPTITFSMSRDIKTFCSQDFVYVYDGIPGFMSGSSTSAATLLAAYCGYGTKQPLSVEAKSGYLTVYFEGNLSPNSNTRGFNATYRVNNCPSRCVGNQVCVGSRCVCKPGYGGVNCELTLCPHNCSSDRGQGHCDKIMGQCVCKAGYGGSSCALPISKHLGYYSLLYDPWRISGIGAFNSTLGRMGHTFVSCDGIDIYLFGGYSLSRGSMNDLWKYNVKTASWQEVKPTTVEQPQPRYLHAAVCVPALHAMYVFGGLVEKSGAVKDLWKYNLDSRRWTQLQIQAMTGVPSMAGHTMTLVDQTTIIVVGGFSSVNYYSETTYEYDASTDKWTKVELKGTVPTGLYSHSAVFHAPSNALYVFGGYEYQTDKTVASRHLYALDLKTKKWSLLPPEDNNLPLQRYFHTAVTTADYMVILGGRTVSDFDNSVMAYRYNCNKWMDLSPGAANIYGEGMTAVIGAAAVMTGQDIYVMGGFNGLSHGLLVKLSLPEDLCTLYADAESCGSALGCTSCTVRVINGTNTTHCFSNTNQLAARCNPGGNTTVWIHRGADCDRARTENRRCEQHKTCSECLAVWPVHRDAARKCQWCSNCPTGKCIPRKSDCQALNVCRRQQRVMLDTQNCVERLCQASDCEKCDKQGNCIWTRQFKRSTEVGRTLSLVPIYDWNCVTKSLLDATPYAIESMPPRACPMRCYQYTTCTACLGAVGGEGGAQKCVWSETMKECMPPAFLPLRCSNGECGHILNILKMVKRAINQCPQPCSIHTQCSKCLAVPGCGWCAFHGLNGLGVCMEGGLMGPKHGLCSAQNVSLANGSLPEPMYNWSSIATGPPAWAFGKCPPENECTNDHHTCDRSENCTNLLVGFRCDCKNGFVRDINSNKCKPVCKQGCEPYGNCVAPNRCLCNFGYVGHNCSTECQCNKHSNCSSVTETDVCLECHHNTQGRQCEQCKALFVGNPLAGGACKSCYSHCYGHSRICLSRAEYNRTLFNPSLPLHTDNITSWINHGPQMSAVCLHCGDNTEGDRCDTCKKGYFRLKKTSKPTDPCRPCECHGHSNTCNRDTGENCHCGNATKSPHCDSTRTGSDTGESKKACWEQQCSICQESFLGTPTDGHQCYRQMMVDREYCFDPVTQMNCNNNPIALLDGRSVFFAVQPKYLNVDIRITLDVTSGGLDVYFSPWDDTYVVKVNKLTGRHSVEIDCKYRYTKGASNVRRRREAQRTTPTNSNSSESFEEQNHLLREHSATDLNTFITVDVPDTFLIVRNVQHRLVITLPNDIHSLKVTRFYLVLVANGANGYNRTVGNLFFRQDQPHIDLFVFFSVFFSCFFLFLAKCVLLWKIKQAFDAQRSRQRRQLEMEHMASRPFSKALVLVDQKLAPAVSPPLVRKNRLPKHSSKYSINSDSHLSPVEDNFDINPLALEPTDDGIAAIGTFIFQLPGGTGAPVRACLGSALITMRVMYPNLHHGPKNVLMRRRPSSSNA